MKKLIWVLVVSVLVTSCATTQASFDFSKEEILKFYVMANDDDPLNLYDVIQKEIEFRGYEVKRIISINKIDQPERNQSSSGSGFFVSKEGLILTCAHVVSNADKIVVKKQDKTFEASVVLMNPSNDLALLKVDGYEPEHFFKIEKFASQKLGDKIYTIGFPLSDILGAEARITDGIISARNGLDSNPTYFQITASIQPGNSGGPILNQKYEVIGITSSKLSDSYAIEKTGSIPQNINFRIKSEIALLLTEDQIDTDVVSSIKTISDSIEACIQIVTNPDSPKKVNGRNLLITIQYTYSWDAIHYTLSRLKIDFVDPDSGDIVGSGSFVGSSFGSAKMITQDLIEEVLNKIQN